MNTNTSFKEVLRSYRGAVTEASLDKQKNIKQRRTEETLVKVRGW